MADACLRIPLPDPFVPGVTAIFVLDGGSEPWVLDAGADTAESERAMRQALDAMGIVPEQTRFVLSHTHLDHAGGLRRFRPAFLAAHARAAREMKEAAPRSSRGPIALRRMGLAADRVAALAPDGEPIHGTPLADVRVDRSFEGGAGELESLEDWTWHLAEGHAPGHVLLFHAPSATLLGADQFLQKWKTPLLISDPDFDSFGAYRASIDTALALRPARICSSHTETIEPAIEWLETLAATLDRRMGRIVGAVREGASTAEEVLERLYPQASRGPLRIVFLRENLAMLRHLAARRDPAGAESGLERHVRDGVEVFSRPGRGLRA